MIGPGPGSRPRLYAGGALASGAAFLLLALLVAAGDLDRVDRFAVRHLMPGLSSHEARTSLLGSLLSYHGHSFHLTGVVKLPASALLSSLVVAATCAILWRRGRRAGAALWAGAFAVAVAVELVCKATITKPALYTTTDDGPLHLTGFDSSFPSGHAVRGAMLVAVVASVWPRLRPLLLVWLVALVCILELDAIHTPSDIVAGLLLATTLVLLVALGVHRLGPAGAARRTGPVGGREPAARFEGGGSARGRRSPLAAGDLAAVARPVSEEE